MRRLCRITILTAVSPKPKYWIFSLAILCCTCQSIWLFCENTIDKMKSLRLFMDEEEASLFWKQLISFCDKLKLLHAFCKSNIAHASFKNICAAWPFSCQDSKGEYAFQWYIFKELTTFSSGPKWQFIVLIFFLPDLRWVLQCEVLHRCQSTRCRKLAQVHQICWLLWSAQPCCMPDKWPGMF